MRRKTEGKRWIGLSIVASAMLVGLAGCAPTVWNKPGGTQQSFSADSYRCEQQGLAVAPVNPQVTSVRRDRDRRGRVTESVSTSDVNQSARTRLFRDCMYASGWREGPVNPPPAPVLAAQPAPQRAPAVAAAPTAPMTAAPGSGSLCQPGVRLFARSEGAWYAASAVAQQPQGCLVTFDGLGASENEVVAGNAIMPWAAQGPGSPVQRCQRGDQVVAFSEDGWYPAVVKETRASGNCPVHYVDEPADEDESLPMSRLRQL